MKHLGIHLLLEYWDCNREKLDSKEILETIMVKAAEVSGATVLQSVFQDFNPQGVSGVVVIAESHLTIHSWPELGYAAIDIFTCGDKVDPWKATQYLEDELEVKEVEVVDMFRGILRH